MSGLARAAIAVMTSSVTFHLMEVILWKLKVTQDHAATFVLVLGISTFVGLVVFFRTRELVR